MRSLCHNVLSLVLGTLLAAPVFGSGGGGGGGGEKKLSDSHIENEYKRLMLQLTQEETKVRDGRHHIRELIKAREASAVESEKAQYNRQMDTAHKGLSEANQRLLEIRTKIKYRFPEKDDESIRRYYPERVESLEQMEKEVGLEGELSQMRVLINKVYGPFLSAEFKAEQEMLAEKKSSPKDRTPAAVEESKKLKLVK